MTRDNAIEQQNGISSLEDLAGVLAEIKTGGGKVVHCHGVFDLLHIGHIRHLEEAKKLGDVLVVTITPDRFVNKGPSRPAFTENLRAEALAALEIVDYVAINQWPIAVETIRLLEPDFYVKGPDYQDAGQDITGGITLEQEAIASVGGHLVHTNDITFSSSKLINQHMPALPKETTEFLNDFSTRYSETDLAGYLNNTSTLKVLVVGEAIIDEYQYCQAIGKSSKEPMLAVKQTNTERFAGGILAVANNVANFSENVGLVTVLGSSNSHKEFISGSLDSKINAQFLYRDDAPTIVKRRFIEEYHFTKLLEVYEINDEHMSSTDTEALCEYLRNEAPKYDAVLVVDFGHGMLGPESLKVLCEYSKFLAVNSQSNAGNLGYHTISRFPRADFVCMAENEARLESRDRHGDLRKVILNVAKEMDCDRIVVTRGKNGCLCYDESKGFFELPALADQVMDRMGSGDAFLSVAAMCVAQNVPMEAIGFIGNVVGAEAVATVGHRSSIQRLPLIRHIQTLLK